MGSEQRPETADLHSSSEDYARRFAGPVGAWFLELQAKETLGLMSALPPKARILDVGGGHAQLTPALVDAGYEVLVLGSSAACGHRIARLVTQDRCRFDVGSLTALPYDDASFDAAISFRMMAHVSNWPALISELCRVARSVVMVDYPSRRSVNILATLLFGLKMRVEGNTRPFRLFWPNQIRQAFLRHNFHVTATRPQFALPMALHRAVGSASIAKAVEALSRGVGATRWFGSPIIVRATRAPTREGP